MTEKQVSLEHVFSQLAAEGYLDTNWQTQANTLLTNFEQSSPWYVRAMVGFGAWLASLLFIVFVMVMDFFSNESGYTVFGFILVAAAVALRHVSNNDFSRQFTLAISLAGQVFFAIGINSLVSIEELAVPLSSLILLNFILLVVFPDNVHRFLSVIIIISNTVILLYDWKVQELLPWLTLLLLTAFVYLTHSEQKLELHSWGEWLRPIITGLLVSAFACVLLSTLYIIPELIDDFVFYPYPWIATLGCAAILLTLEQKFLPDVLGGKQSSAMMVIYGMTLLLMTTAFSAPGLLFSLVVLLLGMSQHNRFFIGCGLAFLSMFTISFFYGIQISLLMKSGILILSGLIILGGRWGLLYALRLQQEKGHA